MSLPSDRLKLFGSHIIPLLNENGIRLMDSMSLNPSRQEKVSGFASEIIAKIIRELTPHEGLMVAFSLIDAIIDCSKVVPRSDGTLN